MPKILVTAFDDEFCDEVTKVLGSKGIHAHCGNRVASIDGNGQVESVTLDNGGKIQADMASGSAITSCSISAVSTMIRL